MSGPFDPYLQWLGLEGEGIPSHYELFGLRAKESDRAIIQKMADARIAQLKGTDPGEHREVWEQLVAYLGEVRDILLDPAAKTEYDATLPDPAGAPPTKPSGATPKPSSTPGPPAPQGVSLAVPPGMPSEPSPEPPKSGLPAGPPVSPPTGLPVGTPVGTPVAPPSSAAASGLPVGIPVAQSLPGAEDDSGELDGIGVSVTGGGSRGRLPLKPRKRGAVQQSDYGSVYRRYSHCRRAGLWDPEDPTARTRKAGARTEARADNRHPKEEDNEDTSTEP